MNQLPQNLKEEIINQLVELKLAGPGCGHERHLNLKAIGQLKAGQPKATFGLDGWADYSEEELLQIIAKYTNCPLDFNLTEGPGYIDPFLTLTGLYEAALVLAKACQKKEKVLLGTGHTGGMTGYYLELARILENLGCEILDQRGAGLVVDQFPCPHCGQHDVEVRVDYLGKVALVSDGEILRHTHATQPMDAILDVLDQENNLPDLVLADHGFAGAALKRGILTIAVMDTNDPALALAKHLGKVPLVLIPMDDNRPNYITAQVAKMLEKLIKMVW